MNFKLWSTWICVGLLDIFGYIKIDTVSLKLQIYDSIFKKKSGIFTTDF